MSAAGTGGRGTEGRQVIVVSNRGPRSFRFDDDANLVPVGGGGGLVSSLRPLLSGGDATWISMTMGPADVEAQARGLMVDDTLSLLSVTVDPDVYQMAYDVVANTTLWYTHHHLFDLPRRPRFDSYWHRAWDGYRAYNRAMADQVAAHAHPGAVVLVQDYHFSLARRDVREARADLSTVHFCHIPFADPNMLAVLPDGAVGELLAGMAGFDAVGFHSARWADGFAACYADPQLAGLAGLAPDGATDLCLTALARTRQPDRRSRLARLRGGARTPRGRDRWPSHHRPRRPG